jgi:hypothetical protein
MPTEEENIAYYRRRIAACTEQALRAESPSARGAHEALARLYREKLVALGADPGPHDEQGVGEPGAIREADDKPPAQGGHPEV